MELLDPELLLSHQLELPLLHLVAETHPHLLQLVPLAGEVAHAQVNPPQPEVPQLSSWLDVH